jgi:hypothetical protein
MLVADCGLVRSQPPAFEGKCDAESQVHRIARRRVPVQYRNVYVAVTRQSIVAIPSV